MKHGGQRRAGAAAGSRASRARALAAAGALAALSSAPAAAQIQPPADPSDMATCSAFAASANELVSNAFRNATDCVFSLTIRDMRDNVPIGACGREWVGEAAAKWWSPPRACAAANEAAYCASNQGRSAILACFRKVAAKTRENLEAALRERLENAVFSAEAAAEIRRRRSDFDTLAGFFQKKGLDFLAHANEHGARLAFRDPFVGQFVQQQLSRILDIERAVLGAFSDAFAAWDAAVAESRAGSSPGLAARPAPGGGMGSGGGSLQERMRRFQQAARGAVDDAQAAEQAIAADPSHRGGLGRQAWRDLADERRAARARHQARLADIERRAEEQMQALQGGGSGNACWDAAQNRVAARYEGRASGQIGICGAGRISASMYRDLKAEAARCGLGPQAINELDRAERESRATAASACSG